MRPKLSICIPTFNRAQSLSDALESLSTILKRSNLGPKVQICVSDNASTDQTSDIIRTYGDAFSHFSYNKNPKNLGYSRNLLNAIRLSEGDYVLPIGDDDHLNQECIEILLDLCHTEHGLSILAPAGPHSHHAAIDQVDTLNSALRTLKAFDLSPLGRLLMNRALCTKYLDGIDTRTIYPQAVLAWKLIKEVGARLVTRFPLQTDDKQRNWVHYQPVFTSIDMARVLTEGPLALIADSKLSMLHYRLLMRSIPRAIFRSRTGRITIDESNPYRSLAVPNIRSVYSHSRKASMYATWIARICHCLPLSALSVALRERGPNNSGTGRELQPTTMS
jgi:glycosyltransferase involved in cell wall biosynthesis